jgi:HD-GYP domain-containing protein (c-di-GMP phosphodiesterase class II)
MMEISEESLIIAIQSAAVSVCRRGFDLLAESPERFQLMSGQAFNAYLPALAADLQTAELYDLLDQARAWQRNLAIAASTPLSREAGRLVFWQCLQNAVPSLDWTHPQRVARISILVGAELGFSEPALEDLYWGALLHDVGKIFVEDFVNFIEKEGFTFAVMPMMRTHAALGRLFMESVRPLFPLGALCAGQHQESVDGSGYPDGLSYEQLTVVGKIVNLADGYDATVTRVGWTLAEACEEAKRLYLLAGYGDAPVLQAFLRIVARYHSTWYGAESSLPE